MKKILFVCHQNVGRSQVAMELYRQHGGQADSAGTAVDAPQTTLAERPRAATIVKVMRDDYAIDMINNVRRQITQEMAAPYEELVVMAEPETWPEWLKTDKRVVYWPIDDPKDQDEPTTRRIVKEVEAHVTNELL